MLSKRLRALWNSWRHGVANRCGDHWPLAVSPWWVPLRYQLFWSNRCGNRHFLLQYCLLMNSEGWDSLARLYERENILCLHEINKQYKSSLELTIIWSNELPRNLLAALNNSIKSIWRLSSLITHLRSSYEPYLSFKCIKLFKLFISVRAISHKDIIECTLVSGARQQMWLLVFGIWFAYSNVNLDPDKLDHNIAPIHRDDWRLLCNTNANTNPT